MLQRSCSRRCRHSASSAQLRARGSVACACSSATLCSRSWMHSQRDAHRSHLTPPHRTINDANSASPTLLARQTPLCCCLARARCSLRYCRAPRIAAAAARQQRLHSLADSIVLHGDQPRCRSSPASALALLLLPMAHSRILAGQRSNSTLAHKIGAASTVRFRRVDPPSCSVRACSLALDAATIECSVLCWAPAPHAMPSMLEQQAHQHDVADLTAVTIINGRGDSRSDASTATALLSEPPAVSMLRQSGRRIEHRRSPSHGGAASLSLAVHCLCCCTDRDRDHASAGLLCRLDRTLSVAAALVRCCLALPHSTINDDATTRKRLRVCASVPATDPIVTLVAVAL